MTDYKAKQLLRKNNSTESSKKAIPEPRPVKGRILKARDEAHDFHTEFRNYRDKPRLEALKEKIDDFYRLVWIYIEDLRKRDREYYKKLEQIKKAPLKVENIDEEFEKWSKWLDDLDMLLKKLGITDIGVRREESNFAYSIFEGTPFSGFEKPITRKEARNWTNWFKLQSAIKTYATKLKEDADGLIIIWGGNRTGKTTLSLQLTQLVHPKPLTKKNIVFDNNDFYEATENLNKFSAFHIDELSSLFYSKNAMTKKQKNRKRKLKTYAKKNMIMFGCDLNFYNLDKELISDKVTAAIHIPKRGKFEYYNKDKVNEFEKDKKTGEAKTPSAKFKGTFPKLEGRVWDIYKEMEDRKIAKNGEKDKEKQKIDESLQHECSQCGYKWKGKTENPSQCPKCGSRKWDS